MLSTPTRQNRKHLKIAITFIRKHKNSNLYQWLQGKYFSTAFEALNFVYENLIAGCYGVIHDDGIYDYDNDCWIQDPTEFWVGISKHESKNNIAELFCFEYER